MGVRQRVRCAAQAGDLDWRERRSRGRRVALDGRYALLAGNVLRFRAKRVVLGLVLDATIRTRTAGLRRPRRKHARLVRFGLRYPAAVRVRVLLALVPVRTRTPGTASGSSFALRNGTTPRNDRSRIP